MTEGFIIPLNYTPTHHGHWNGNGNSPPFNHQYQYHNNRNTNTFTRKGNRRLRVQLPHELNASTRTDTTSSSSSANENDNENDDQKCSSPPPQYRSNLTQELNAGSSTSKSTRTNEKSSSMPLPLPSSSPSQPSPPSQPQYKSNLQKIIQAERVINARSKIMQESKKSKREEEKERERKLKKMRELSERDMRDIGDESFKYNEMEMGIYDGMGIDMDMDMDILDEDEGPYEYANEEYSIDSFLMGEYDRPFAEDAPAPHPGLVPKDTITQSLHALRDLDIPNSKSHGAAVFLRFVCPLSRNDRWGGRVGMMVKNSSEHHWKDIMRGSLTPTMLARRIRSSEEFSVLLDWKHMDVTDGTYMDMDMDMDVDVDTDAKSTSSSGNNGNVAFVNCSLFFGDRERDDTVEPVIVQFKLVKMSGVWLIDSAVRSKKEWFCEESK